MKTTSNIILSVLLIGLPSIVYAREGRAFQAEATYTNGESGTANNALQMESARSLNSFLQGGRNFQSLSSVPRFRGPGASLSLSNDDFIFGWKLWLDYAALKANEAGLTSHDYSSITYAGTTTVTIGDTNVGLKDNRLNKVSLGYMADIYAFRRIYDLRKLGLRIGARLRSDDVRLGDSLTWRSSTTVVTPGTTYSVPLGINLLDSQKYSYQENAAELLAGLSYSYALSESSRLDASITGVYGPGTGRYKHVSTGMMTVANVTVPTTTTMQGKTKLLRSGSIMEVGFNHDFNQSIGLRITYGLNNVQSKMTSSDVKNPNNLPLLPMLTGEYLPYLLDSMNPLGSLPAYSDRDQRIGVALKFYL